MDCSGGPAHCSRAMGWAPTAVHFSVSYNFSLKVSTEVTCSFCFLTAEYYSDRQTSQNTGLDASCTSTDEALISTDKWNPRRPDDRKPHAREPYRHRVYIQPSAYKSPRRPAHVHESYRRSVHVQPPAVPHESARRPVHAQHPTYEYRRPAQTPVQRPRHSSPRQSLLPRHPTGSRSPARHHPGPKSPHFHGPMTDENAVSPPYIRHQIQGRTSGEEEPRHFTPIPTPTTPMGLHWDRTPSEVSRSDRQWETDQIETKVDSRRSPRDQKRILQWRNPSKEPRDSTPIRTFPMPKNPHRVYERDRQPETDETETTQGDRTPSGVSHSDSQWETYRTETEVDSRRSPNYQKSTTHKTKAFKKTETTQGDRTPRDVPHSDSQWETDQTETEVDSPRSPPYRMQDTNNRKPAKKNLFTKTPVHHLRAAMRKGAAVRVTAARNSDCGLPMSTPVAGAPHKMSILNTLSQYCEHSPQRAPMDAGVPPIQRYTCLSQVLRGHNTT